MLQKIISTIAVIAFSLMLYTPVAMAIEEAPPVNVQEIFTGIKQIYGNGFTYLEGKAEMYLYKVDVEAGTEVPLHFHPAPLIGHIQEGELTLKTEKGKRQIFCSGDSFILGVDTPSHAMGNTAKIPAVMLVGVASAEGIPTLTNVE